MLSRAPRNLAVASVALLAAGCFGAGGPAPQPHPAAAEVRLTSEERQQVEVFQDVSRAVVNVANIALVERRLSLFRRALEEVPQGTGSGIVWDRDGHVVTNFHVVSGASSLTVTLADQSVFEAKYVGAYPDKDIALLRIDAPAEKLHPVRLGRSRQLLVGMKALAIGNPFGLDQTFTVGVISSLGREIRSPTGRRITDVIQTDAAVNRGNSGGPLLNARGELVGITTAILSPSGASAGIAFAVPVDAIRAVVEDLIEDGRVTRPGLGVQLWPDELARRYGIEGVWIREVPKDSAAARAGLRGTRVFRDGSVEPGDIIAAVDAQSIATGYDLLDALEAREIGDEVTVTIVREGRREERKVRLQPLVVGAEQ